MLIARCRYTHAKAVSTDSEEFLHSSTEFTNNKALMLRADNLLVGGLIGINIVILQALISLGKPDTPALISLIMLSISIPTAAGFLFLRFIQQLYRITTYEWRVLKHMTTVSGISGYIGITFAIWHASWIAGVIFAITAFLVFWIVMFYFFIVGVRGVARERYVAAQAKSNQPSSPIATEAESKQENHEVKQAGDTMPEISEEEEA